MICDDDRIIINKRSGSGCLQQAVLSCKKLTEVIFLVNQSRYTGSVALTLVDSAHCLYFAL
jgi:hypothetical protein